MSMILPYLIIPLLLLFLIINVIIRISIIRQYKVLREENVDLGQKFFFSEKEIREKLKAERRMKNNIQRKYT